MRWSCTIVACCVAFVAGCGPSLRRSERFTPASVREIQFNDACALQAYFDSGPPPLVQQGESSIASERGAQAGRASFRVEHGAQRAQLARLLDRYYTVLPPRLAAHRGSLVATVPFATTSGGGDAAWRQIPIGAAVELEWGERGETASLPYHPCLSSFFFGQRYFEARRRLLGPATRSR
jgi:hypothetical protein